VNLGRGLLNRYVGWRYPVYGYHRSGYYPYYYDHVSPYGVYYEPRSNYVDYYLPPVYYPAELSYGPQAMKQFMGVDRTFGLGPLLDRPDEPAGRRVDLKPVVRISNAESRDRAGRFIEFGDARFGEQQYHEALQRYKSAAAAAPDVAEAYYKQGLALLATGRYELAVAALKRGVALDPGWPKGDFRLDSVYRDTRIAKTGHLDALAHTALTHPHNADAIYLIGVFLYFDGQGDRAQKFLRRAAELSGNDTHVRPFLRAPREAKKADRVPVPL